MRVLHHNLLKKILILLNWQWRKAFGILILMFFGAIFETFGVGLVPTFANLLIRSNAIEDQTFLTWLYHFFSFQSYNQFLIFISLVLIGIYILKTVYLVFLIYIQYKFTYKQQVLLSRRLLNAYLSAPYTFHLQRNTAELLRNINVEIPYIFDEVMRDIMIIGSEAMTAFCIMIVLFYFDPISFLVALLILGTATTVFYNVVKNRLNILGKVQQYHRGKMIQWVNQSLGGIKESKILGREQYFVENYSKHMENYTETALSFQVLNRLPRLYIEAIVAVSILSIIIINILQVQNQNSILPMLSFLIIAAFRLMVSLNRILTAATTIRFFQHSIDIVVNDLEAFKDKSYQENYYQNSMLLNQSIKSCRKFDYVDNSSFDTILIELKNIYYCYPNTQIFTLKDISLKITKGNIIGFVGFSGSGKTTIIDIILGLLVPTKGEVRINGKNIRDKNNTQQWQSQIGYVPQLIYLTDDTIRRNIAFGLPDQEIEDQRVIEVLKLAQLEDLSGGQRQRIAIARAVYVNPKILVLDEATSALDSEAEQAVQIAINKVLESTTAFIIAHRLSTIMHADRIMVINNGEIEAIGSSDELIKISPTYQKLFKLQFNIKD